MKNSTFAKRLLPGGNIYYVLISRLLIVFLLYSLTRLIYYFINLNMFFDVTFGELIRILIGGLRFDATAIIYTNCIVILMHILPFQFRYNQKYQKAVKWIYFPINIFALGINLADGIYYRFSLRRSTLDVLSEFGNESNGVVIFTRLMYDYWYVLLILGLLTWLMFRMYKQVKVIEYDVNIDRSYYIKGSIIAILLIFLSVVSIRGGFGNKVPLNLNDAAKYIDKPSHRSIVLNTPFTVIRTIGSKELKRQEYFGKSEADIIFSTIKYPAGNSDPIYGKFKGKNVIVFILESFGKDHIGLYTPFIDSLSRYSYIFNRSYANGRKSIDATPSVLASIPSIDINFSISTYSNNNINSIASLLKDRGYFSAFFHGAGNGSLGFDRFTTHAGYDAYYGRTEFGDDSEYDGIWGIWDEPFLQFMARELNTFKEPFHSAVFTLSSHHPFKVPAKYKGVFLKGDLPIQETIGYTDNALRQFFKTASQMPWFENTIFILTADHATEHAEKIYQTPIGDFSVPILIYIPGEYFTGYDDTTVVSQCDILPTVMSMLGYDRRFVSFGNSMFDKQSPHFAVNWQNGITQYIEGDYLLLFDGDKSIALFNYMKDTVLSKNVLKEESSIVSNMERGVKAYIQQYTDAMLNDELSLNTNR